MSINGITVVSDERYNVCYINEFTEELKDLIRAELSSICNGKSEVEEYDLDAYSYENTLADFLKRYDLQTDKTKKGIMGELIAHLIIDKILPNLEKISILFNKEDQAIKKGFDLTYVEVGNSVIWYGEVKSGELGKKHTVDSKNKVLLDNSKKGMKGFLTGQRPNLWKSVLIDVNMSITQYNRKKVKNLLDDDIKQIKKYPGNIKKNAILISVLFHDTNNKISVESVQTCLNDICSEKIFSDAIVFTIQKTTYTKIEEFLKQEISK